jgi:hypothetical protein
VHSSLVEFLGKGRTKNSRSPFLVNCLLHHNKLGWRVDADVMASEPMRYQIFPENIQTPTFQWHSDFLPKQSRKYVLQIPERRLAVFSTIEFRRTRLCRIVGGFDPLSEMRCRSSSQSPHVANFMYAS